MKRTVSVFRLPFIIGPLTLFKRVVSYDDKLPTGDWAIAGWHWPWSLTWSWSLWWSPHLPNYPKAYYIKTNGGFIAGLRIPVIGDFNLQKQAPMRKTTLSKPTDAERDEIMEILR